MNMSLYLIQFEGEEYFVESESMYDAIVTWQDTENKESDDPESVYTLSDNAVLREGE
jgi:hypothetical protein